MRKGFGCRLYSCPEVLIENLREFDELFWEQRWSRPRNGSELVNASEATTWIDIAYLEGRRSIQLSYGRTITATLILEHFCTIPKKNAGAQRHVANRPDFRLATLYFVLLFSQVQ